MIAAHVRSGLHGLVNGPNVRMVIVDARVIVHDSIGTRCLVKCASTLTHLDRHVSVLSRDGQQHIMQRTRPDFPSHRGAFPLAPPKRILDALHPVRSGAEVGMGPRRAFVGQDVEEEIGEVRSMIPVGGMLIVCLLLVFGLTSPNPLSLARAAGFDPDRPGIAAVVRHPVLYAALIWSGAHAIANGDLAHLTVFGAFSALAIGGMLALDARSRRRLGVQEWERLARRTSNIPFLGLARGAALRFRTGTAIRIAAAALLYLLLLFSHEILAGVPVPL